MFGNKKDVEKTITVMDGPRIRYKGKTFHCIKKNKLFFNDGSYVDLGNVWASLECPGMISLEEQFPVSDKELKIVSRAFEGSEVTLSNIFADVYITAGNEEGLIRMQIQGPKRLLEKIDWDVFHGNLKIHSDVSEDPFRPIPGTTSMYLSTKTFIPFISSRPPAGVYIKLLVPKRIWITVEHIHGHIVIDNTVEPKLNLSVGGTSRVYADDVTNLNAEIYDEAHVSVELRNFGNISVCNSGELALLADQCQFLDLLVEENARAYLKGSCARGHLTATDSARILVTKGFENLEHYSLYRGTIEKGNI